MHSGRYDWKDVAVFCLVVDFRTSVTRITHIRDVILIVVSLGRGTLCLEMVEMLG